MSTRQLALYSDCTFVQDWNNGTDPRHYPLRDFIRTMQLECQVPEQWNGRSARALANWLKANPTVSLQDAQQLIRNRFGSDEPAGSPPFDWLPRLTKYWQGPLDRYGRVWRPDWRAGYEGMR